MNGNNPFVAGCKERIDFGEIIGEFALKEPGKETIFILSNARILHYANDGVVHLIPLRPYRSKMNRQEKLSYIAQVFIKRDEWPTLRGVMAKRNDQTLCISFYFSEKFTDHLREDASVLASEILAQYVAGLLQEDYIYLASSQPLPESPFWI